MRSLGHAQDRPHAQSLGLERRQEPREARRGIGAPGSRFVALAKAGPVGRLRLRVSSRPCRIAIVHPRDFQCSIATTAMQDATWTHAFLTMDDGRRFGGWRKDMAVREARGEGGVRRGERQVSGGDASDPKWMRDRVVRERRSRRDDEERDGCGRATKEGREGGCGRARK